MSHASPLPTLVATSDGLEFPPPAPQLMQAPVALSVSRNGTSEINNQHGSPSVNEAPPQAAPRARHRPLVSGCSRTEARVDSCCGHLQPPPGSSKLRRGPVKGLCSATGLWESHDLLWESHDLSRFLCSARQHR